MWPLFIGIGALWFAGRTQRLTGSHPVTAIAVGAPTPAQALSPGNQISSPGEETAQMWGALVAGEGDGEIASSVATYQGAPASSPASGDNPELSVIQTRPRNTSIAAPAPGTMIGRLVAQVKSPAIQHPSISKTPIVTRPAPARVLPARKTISPNVGAGRSGRKGFFAL